MLVSLIALLFAISFPNLVFAEQECNAYTPYQIGCFNKAICNQNSSAYLKSAWEEKKVGEDPNGANFISNLCSIPNKPDSVCCFAGNSIPDIKDAGTKSILCPLKNNHGFEVSCLDFPAETDSAAFNVARPAAVEDFCNISSDNAMPGVCGQNDCWKVTVSYNCVMVSGKLTCQEKNKCSDFCAQAPTTPDPKAKCEQKAACVYKAGKCEIRPEAVPIVKAPVDPNVAIENAAIAADKALYSGKAKEIFNQLGTTDPTQLIGRIINGAIGILGSISLVMFIYGGILWMTAAGDSGKTEKAREIVLWTSLGLAVVFAGYALVNFIFEAFR